MKSTIHMNTNKLKHKMNQVVLYTGCHEIPENMAEIINNNKKI